jgi:WD40 repeat protein
VIVSGSYDDTIHVWDLESGKQACAPLGRHRVRVSTLGVAEREGRTVVVSGSDDQTIRVWDLESSESLRTIEVRAPVNSIVSMAGSNIVSGATMGLICVRLH